MDNLQVNLAFITVVLRSVHTRFSPSYLQSSEKYLLVVTAAVVVVVVGAGTYND